MSKNIITFYNLKDRDNAAVTPPSSLWTPSELSTAYWWDASDATSITESANKVSAWEDQTQLASIVQSNGANQPTTNTRNINGLNAIDFDGSTSKMIFPAASAPSLNGYTKFIVFQLDTQANNGNNLISGVTSGPSGGANGSDALFQRFSGGYRLFQDGDQPYGSINVPINTTTLIIATADSVDSELYINGTQDTLTGTIGKVDGTGFSLNGDWEIGTFFGGGFLNGMIASMVVVPSILSQTDREKLEGWAAHTYGATANLNVAHPYKSTAPTV